MNKHIYKYIKLLFNNSINSIPEKYIDQFSEEGLAINIYRERIYAIILFIWNSFMLIYIGLGAFNDIWVKVPAYKYEFYLHVSGLLITTLFMWKLFKNRGKICQKNKKSIYILSIWFIIFVVCFTTIMAIVDLSINQQLTVYIIGIMTVSISLIIRPKESVFICFLSYIILVIGTVATQNNREIIESSVLNGIIMVVLGLAISKMIFNYHIIDFIKSKVIEEKNLELENSQNVLEKTLLKRTQELASANEQLVREINARHDMEIQVLKADLEYQKKVTALNEAIEYDKLRGEFFANISHELRTPLNMIFCTMQMINSSLEKNEAAVNRDKLNNYTTLMKQNCYRLLRLINNIIDITKIDAGYMSINLNNHDIVQMAESITMSVVDYAQHYGLTVIFDTEVEEKIIACDCDKIERIILNLLSNAIKYTEPNGSIYVNIHEINDHIAIKVKDTGIGIPKEMQEAIFERFIQVDKSITRSKEGSGIGLSLVKSFVEMHKGRVSVISQPGQGSEFIIELPVVTIECEEKNVKNTNNIDVVNIEMINQEFADIYQ